MSRPAATHHFNLTARVLHWSMALGLLAMLFIGVGMVASLSLRPTLVSVHRPLGIALLLLVIVRLANRLRHPPPALPSDLPHAQVLAAKASHGLLYALMFAMPVIGWAMLSAGGYPVTMLGGFTLPPIAPHHATLYAVLRTAHTWLALLLFATVLMHLAAALFHAWVRRDGVFEAMAHGEPAAATDAVNASGGSSATESTASPQADQLVADTASMTPELPTPPPREAD